MKRLVLQMILLVCVIPFTVSAQNANMGGSDTGTAKHACHFTYSQGSAAIGSGLGNNAEVLSQLDAFIQSTLSNTYMNIRRIRLSGFSSIEGDYKNNERLAYERVMSFRDYLFSRYSTLSRYPVDIVWIAEDWEGLGKLVRSSALPERYEVLEIIRKNASYDVREELLIKLNGGPAYEYMVRNMFNQLRRVEIEIEYDMSSVPVTRQEPVVVVEQPKKESVVVERTEPKSTFTPDQINESMGIVSSSRKKAEKEIVYVFREREASEKRRTMFALKTNVLQWTGVQPDFKYTTPVANVALEYYITPNWSVEAGAMYSYWRYNHNQEFQGISGYRLEPRYRYSFPCEWLEVYLGLYGRVGDYDRMKLEKDPETGLENEESTNHTGDYWDAGLSAGFQFNLPYNWAIEVGARVGYVKTSAIQYTRDNKYNWFKSREPYDKFRVTDLNVSLLYRF